MAIQKIGSDLIRPTGAEGHRDATAAAKPAQTDEVQRVARADRVEISAEGRELAAQMAQGHSEGLSASRMSQIQERIEQAFYERPTIAERIAERLLISGDLDLEG